MELVDVEFNGSTYPSVEHAYQSAKSNDDGWNDICLRRDLTPYQIKAKSKFVMKVENWEEIKIGVMKELVYKKFSTPQFKELLLGTNDENIVEGNMWGDKFWGVDIKNTPNEGENHLGRILMDVRNMLKNE